MEMHTTNMKVKIGNYLDLSLGFLFMEFKPINDSNKWLEYELYSIFRGKSPSQRDFMLKILKVLSE